MGVSGNAAQVEARHKSFSPLAEDMEGFALAHVGKAFKLPVAQVRGISNKAGNRNRATWDLDLSSRNAQLTVLEYICERF